MGNSGSMGGGTGGFDISGLITSGVDDLMQSTEFWTNTYINNLSKEAKQKRKMEKRYMDAQTDLLKLQGNELKISLGQKRKVRELLYGYR